MGESSDLGVVDLRDADPSGGTHDPVPHWLSPPCPHTSPFEQVPHDNTTPSSQPSPESPQPRPSSSHVFGLQAVGCGPMHDDRSNNMNSSVFS